MCYFSTILRPTSVATLTILSILSFQLSAVPLPQVASVTVKTRAPQNELVTVWYRIPGSRKITIRARDRCHGCWFSSADATVQAKIWPPADSAGGNGPTTTTHFSFLRASKTTTTGSRKSGRARHCSTRWSKSGKDTTFVPINCSSTATQPEASARICSPLGGRGSPVPGCHTPAAYFMNRQPQCASWPDL